MINSIKNKNKNINFKAAFTIAEVMIVFVIISFVVMVGVRTIHESFDKNLNKFMYYSAFENLKSAVAETLAINSTIDFATTSGTTFCTYLTDVINTIGTITCSATGTTDFPSLTPNFTASNGMKFYNFGAAATPPYTIYVDIDGPRRTSTLDTDVMEFTITSDRTVLPAAGSVASDSTDYLTASVTYLNTGLGRLDWFVQNVSYKNAACTAGKITGAAYCGTYTAETACVDGTYECNVVINKPGTTLMSF